MPQKIAIIGAGVIGAAIAYRAALTGAEVTLIEGIGPAVGASGKSFGWINASFGETDDYTRFRMAALEAHRRLDTDLGGTTVRWGGSLWWEETGTAFEAQVNRLEALQYAHRVLDRAQFLRLAPKIANPPAQSLHVMQEGAVEGGDLVARLLAAAARDGARIRMGCTATGFRTSGGRVTGVETSHGHLAADTTVVAAGLGSVALLASIGVSLPMESVAGLILHTAPLPPVVDHLILAPELHFRQAPDGSLIAGETYSGRGGMQALIEAAPDTLGDDLLRRLSARLPGFDIHAKQILLGHRPMPKDGLPLLGPVGPEGIYLAVAHSGVTLSALIGELVAQELTSGPATALAPYRPDRA
jgi:D-hydroxyproline dehydrogenase subunit beta